MTRATQVLCGVVAVGLASVGVAGGVQRNWAYVQLARGRSSVLGEGPVESGRRPAALLALRRAATAGEWSAAQQLLAARDGRDTLPPILMAHEAERRAASGDLAGARAALAIVSAQTAYAADVWYRVGEAEERAGADDEALAAYVRGTSRDAAAPWSEGRYRALLVSQRTQRWQAIVDLMSPIVGAASDADLKRPVRASDPGGALWQGTLLALGDAYERLGDRTAAEATFERVSRVEAPRRDWTFNRSLVSLARLRRERGDRVAAADPVARALDVSTEFEAAYRQRFELDTAAEVERLVDDARVANELPALDAAVEAMTRRAPPSGGAWFVRGVISEARCDVDRARAAYAQAAHLVRAGSGAFLMGRPQNRANGPCAKS